MKDDITLQAVARSADGCFCTHESKILRAENCEIEAGNFNIVCNEDR